MEDYIITACSTSDLAKEHYEQISVPYVCFHFMLDGKEYMDDLGETIPFPEFYNRIAQGAMPTTSQVNVNEFIDFFEPFLREGKDILHVSLSTGLSGAYQSASIAAEELLEKYPERKIKTIDSLGASSGYGLLIDTVASMRDNGKTLEEVYEWLNENKLRLHHWFFSTDLTHYKRGGRISAASAAIGKLINICPLMNMDNEGRLIPRTKVRGKKTVIKEIVKKMELHAEGGLQYSGKCYICHSDCYDDARQVADLVESKFLNLNGKIIINNVGTVIGSHTGPGTVALFFFGDEREQ